MKSGPAILTTTGIVLTVFVVLSLLTLLIKEDSEGIKNEIESEFKLK